MNAMAKKRKGKRKRIHPSVKRNRAIVPSVYRIRYKHSLIPHPSTISTTKNDWMTPLTVLGAGFGAYQLLKKPEPIAPPPSTNVIDGNSLAVGIPVAGFLAYQYCQWKSENCEWLKRLMKKRKPNIVESSKNGIQSAMNNVKAKIESADGENIKNKVNSFATDASTTVSNVGKKMSQSVKSLFKSDNSNDKKGETKRRTASQTIATSQSLMKSTASLPMQKSSLNNEPSTRKLSDSSIQPDSQPLQSMARKLSHQSSNAIIISTPTSRNAVDSRQLSNIKMDEEKLSYHSELVKMCKDSYREESYNGRQLTLMNPDQKCLLAVQRLQPKYQLYPVFFYSDSIDSLSEFCRMYDCSFIYALKLDKINLTDAGLTFISELLYLKQLEFSKCNMKEKIVKTLTIESLILFGLSDTKPFLSFDMPRLKSLEMSFNHNVDRNQFIQLSQQLEELIVENQSADSKWFTDKNYKWTQLKRLTLTNAAISDTLFLLSLNTLEYLDLRLNNINELKATHFNLPSLKELNLIRNPQLNSIKGLENANLPSLKRLHLDAKLFNERVIQSMTTSNLEIIIYNGNRIEKRIQMNE